MLGWITQVVVCLPAIFLAIAVVNPKIASADGNTFLLYDDVDAPGYDFGYFDPPTLDWCQNQCRNERQCKAFTYNHRKQVCFLKRNARAPLKRHWGATTGIKVGANRISRKSNRDAPGNDYKSFSPPTLPDCKNLCDEEPNCKAFTFNKSKQVCFLKNKQDPSRVRYNGAITGVKVARNSRPPPTETGDPMPTKNDVTTGTGFAVSNNGLILTNNHVVEQCDAITVRGKGSARIKEIDERNDLALLKIEGETYAAEFSSAAPPQGRSVYALGFPYSGLLSTSVNFTDGVISALSGIGNDSRYLQFTAPIQPGNSGGPLVDDHGHVVGIVTARLKDIEILKASGSLPQNVNFAIRGEFAKSFLKANGVKPLVAEGEIALTQEAIAATAKKFTVQIVCH